MDCTAPALWVLIVVFGGSTAEPFTVVRQHFTRHERCQAVLEEMRKAATPVVRVRAAIRFPL